MRMFDIEWMVNEVVDTFVEHVYPIVDKIMIGEVRSVTANIFTRGSRDKDIFARTKLRNKEVISAYRIDIWTEDLMRLCRKHKMFLVTPDIFKIVTLFYMFHPLFTAKLMESPSPGEIYDSIYSGATDKTCQMITRHFQHPSYIQHVALDLLKYTAMVDCNHSFDLLPNESPVEYQLKNIRYYREYMLDHYRQAYYTAVKFKANYYEVDHDGFMVLEKANNKLHESMIIEREIEKGDTVGITLNPNVNWSDD